MPSSTSPSEGKEVKPMTALDMVNAIILLVSGFVIAYILSSIPKIINAPHSGFLILGAIGISIFGVVRYIIKFLRQPIKKDELQ